MDKFNELDLQYDVKLENISTTAFLQITDAQQLESTVITTSTKHEDNETLESSLANIEIDKSTLALEIAGGISTSSNPQETAPVKLKDSEFQGDDMLLLFEHDIPVYLNSESSSPISSDAFNDAFHTPDSSQIDSTVEDASECLIAFDITPETLADSTNDAAAMSCFYDQDVHTMDILFDFSPVSTVENEIVFGSKDLDSPLGAGLVVSVCPFPFGEVETHCSDMDKSVYFSSVERQSLSGVTSPTSATLADEINSFELSPSFLARLPSPISSEMLAGLEEDATSVQHSPDMMQVVHSTLVEDGNKMHNTDHREGNADEKPLNTPLFLQHTAENPNWANAPTSPAVPPRRPRQQNDRRRGRLPEPRDSSQKLSTVFPVISHTFEPILKRSDSKMNQLNVIPKLPMTTAKSSSDLHRSKPGPASAVDNRYPQNVAISLVNANFHAHPSSSASWRRVSKSHPEIGQSTTLPRARRYSYREANTNLKNTLPSLSRTHLMHRARPSLGKELYHENIRPLLLGSPLLSEDASDFKKKTSGTLLQAFRPGYEDYPRPMAPDHIPPRLNFAPKQYKAADDSFAFRETKKGVSRRMHSNIPVSAVNKRHGSEKNERDEKKNATSQTNSQQLGAFKERSRVPHNPCRTPCHVGLPKASQGQPRVGAERLQQTLQKSTTVSRSLSFKTTSSQNQDQFVRHLPEADILDNSQLSRQADLPIPHAAIRVSNRFQSVHATSGDKRDRIKLASGPQDALSFDEFQILDVPPSQVR